MNVMKSKLSNCVVVVTSWWLLAVRLGFGVAGFLFVSRQSACQEGPDGSSVKSFIIII